MVWTWNLDHSCISVKARANESNIWSNIVVGWNVGFICVRQKIATFWEKCRIKCWMKFDRHQTFHPTFFMRLTSLFCWFQCWMHLRNHVGWKCLRLLRKWLFMQLFEFFHGTFRPTFRPTMNLKCWIECWIHLRRPLRVGWQNRRV